jgi:hypothetical protein
VVGAGARELAVTAEAIPADVEELGTPDIRRAWGLALLRQAAALQAEADREFIIADIITAAPAAEARFHQAGAALQAAEDALKGPRAALDALEAELADVTARVGNIAALIDGGPDVDTRVRARQTRVALEEEAEAIRQRITAHRRDALTVPEQDLAAARHEVKLAEAAIATLDAAAGDPFGDLWAQRTAGYGLRIRRVWNEVIDAGDTTHPEWKAARARLKAAAVASGLAEELQRDAITAYKCGDPIARGVGGNTTYQDGQIIVSEPGRPTVVGHSAATRAEIASLPGPAPVDSTPASVLVEQAWRNVVSAHNSAAGLPGIHFETRPVAPPGSSHTVTK